MNNLRQWRNLLLLELEIQYLNTWALTLFKSANGIWHEIIIVLFMQDQSRGTPNNEQNEVASHGQYRSKLIIFVGEMLDSRG